MFSVKLTKRIVPQWKRLATVSSSKAGYSRLRENEERMPRYDICTSHKSTDMLYRQKLKKEWNNWHDNISLFSIYKFFPAIIIALLGIKEVLCKEEEAKEGSPRSHLKPKVEDSSKQTPEAKSDTGTIEDVKKSVGKEDKCHPNEILPGKKSSEEIEILQRRDSKIGTSIDVEPPVYKEKNICCNDTPLTLKIAIETAKSYISRKMIEDGAPGASVAVSIDGKVVWSEGMGYSDVENSIRMSSASVLRVASISKSLTMVAVGQLIEEGKLDLDAPIQKYVPTFPKKIVDGEEVTITTRHLLNHTSGIRHYRLTQNKKSKVTEKEEDKPNETDENSCESDLDADLKLEQKKEKLRNLISKKLFTPKKRKEFDDEFTLDEYYIKEEFNSIKEALKLFQDDDLLFKPGEGYCYSTHGFTLVSAVVEALREKAFDRVMKDLFTSLSLRNTFLDQHTPLIFRRARNYIRDECGKLQNAPYVDNSYKWAGGGFLSTVMDLLNFGNAMLYSYQATEENDQKGFLKSSTMDLMWASPRPSPPAKSPSRYNLGWCVTDEDECPKAFTLDRKFSAYHTGGAVGASSVLFIYPSEERGSVEMSVLNTVPKGIVVCIIMNLQGLPLSRLALTVSQVFSRVQQEPKVVGMVGGKINNKVYSLEQS